jgi:hypothetical protein
MQLFRWHRRAVCLRHVHERILGVIGRGVVILVVGRREGASSGGRLGLHVGCVVSRRVSIFNRGYWVPAGQSETPLIQTNTTSNMQLVRITNHSH